MRRSTKQLIAATTIAAAALAAVAVDGAGANSGTVKVAQDCHGWSAKVRLNNDVTHDRRVDVTSTIPGYPGFNGWQFDRSYGPIWEASSYTILSGTVTLNIFYANGQLEYSETKRLPNPGTCTTTTTTTEAPTSTTTTTVPPSSTSTTSAPTTSTVPAPSSTSSSTSTTVATSSPSTTRKIVVVPDGPPYTAIAPPAPPADELPHTGTSMFWAWVGFGLFVVGLAGAIFGSRKKGRA